MNFFNKMIPMNFLCSSGFLTNSFMMKVHKILNLFLFPWLAFFLCAGIMREKSLSLLQSRGLLASFIIIMDAPELREILIRVLQFVKCKRAEQKKYFQQFKK